MTFEPQPMEEWVLRDPETGEYLTYALGSEKIADAQLWRFGAFRRVTYPERYMAEMGSGYVAKVRPDLPTLVPAEIGVKEVPR